MLTAAEQRSLHNIKRQLQFPMWKYLLIYGLSFAVLIAIISLAADLVSGTTIRELITKRMLTTIALAPVAGVLFGYIHRWFRIKEYARLKEKELQP